MERDDYRATGYQKLNELRLLKAAAALLAVPADSQQQQQASFTPRSVHSMSSASSTGPVPSALLRSLSNVEHVMPTQQRLSRTSSISTDRPSLPTPPRLGRSNSAGSHRLAAYVPLPTASVMTHPCSARLPTPSGPATPPGDVCSAHQWLRAPRHSEPAAGAGNPDERVLLLLAEVESLLAERQQSSIERQQLLQELQELRLARAAADKDRDLMAELIGRLSASLQDMEGHVKLLQQQLLQHQQCGDCLNNPLPSLSLPASAVQQAAPVPSMTSAMTGVTSVTSVHASQQQQQLLQRQRQVDEWLGRRQETWQQWQERVPLEHMHSGSSSTLTVALD